MEDTNSRSLELALRELTVQNGIPEDRARQALEATGRTGDTTTANPTKHTIL